MKQPVRHDHDGVWAQLLPLVASGLSLPKALAKLPEPRPSLWWVKMAVRADPDLEERYRAAMELRADALADEIAAIADEAIPTDLRGSDASAWVQAQKLKVDSKKWLACKLFPGRYSDRVGIDLAVDQRISITAALEAAQRRAAAVDAVDVETVPVIELEQASCGRSG